MGSPVFFECTAHAVDSGVAPNTTRLVELARVDLRPVLRLYAANTSDPSTRYSVTLSDAQLRDLHAAIERIAAHLSIDLS